MMHALPDGQRDGLHIRRSMWRPETGIVALRQEFTGHGTRVVVTQAASMIARVDVRAGELLFPLLARVVRPPSRFVMVLPPRSTLRMTFRSAHVVTEGLGTFHPPHARCRPALLDWPRDPALRWHVLDEAPHVADLDPDEGVAAGLVAARARLHDHAASLAPVRAAGRAVGMRSDTLARAFAEAYGVTPKRYITSARLFDAVIALLTGAPILDSALRAGFGDLTRFYAQFRRVVGTTPGVYAIKNRQDTSETRL